MSRYTFLVLALVGLLAGFTSCSPGRPSRGDAKTQFERDSGFKLPASATSVVCIIGDVDFHGDYSMALTFVVPKEEVKDFTKLPNSAWQSPQDFKPLSTKEYLAGFNQKLSSDLVFIVPAGAMFISQTGPNDVRRKYAVDEKTGRIYYFRATW